MAREAWPNALNAQLFNINVGFFSVGIYFCGGLFPIYNEVGFFRGLFPVTGKCRIACVQPNSVLNNNSLS